MSNSPFFTIITPTVQRDSLITLCESLDSQVNPPLFEHIIIDDSAEDRGVLAKVSSKNRVFGMCNKPHRNTGNTCRRSAWGIARAEFCIMVDDDNYFYSPTALADIYECVRGMEEQWAVFPIFRHGSRFFFDPPRPCYFDTANAVVRKSVAQWPETDGYAADAVWLEGLMKYPYKAFPDVTPVITVPTSSFGAGGGMNGQ